jgi:hypothetical protein
MSKGKFVQNLSAVSTYLMCLFLFSAASAQTQPNGTYAKSDFGEIEVSCVSSIMCFATYEDGKSFMYLTSPGRDDHYVGYWAEPSSSQACPVAHQFPNIRTEAWGNVDLTFDYHAENWSGFWGYCEEHPARTINGARGQKPAQEDDTNNEHSLKEWLLGSWLPTEDSGARRYDMYTFNPDGTFVISDGAGMNATGTWSLKNAHLFLDGQPVPVPLEFLGQDIKLAGIRHSRETLNGEDYAVRQISGGVEPAGVYIPNWQAGGATPKIGDYALHYVILGPSGSFLPDGSGAAGTPVFVEFWNEREKIKEDENGVRYRDDTVSFEAVEYSVSPNNLTFFAYHPKWGELFFSAAFDGRRVEAQTSYERGFGPRPANADMPIIVGDLMVKGHIFRDVELFLAILN